MSAYFHKTPALLQWLYPGLIWKKDSRNKIIYLTFDDGPIPEITPMVLDLLKERSVKATFFCVGDNIKKHPKVFERVIREGHCVGNHTFNHLNGWKTEDHAYFNNVQTCNDEIEKFGITNKLFRPPYGKIKRSQIKYLRKKYQIIMWDVLSGDFDPTLSTDVCFRHTVEATKRGSIVIFHDNIKAQEKIKYSLPLFLDHFLENGYNFLPL